MTDWTVSMRVTHPAYGPGTLGFVGAEQLGLALDDGRKVLLRREDCPLRPGEHPVSAAPTTPSPPFLVQERDDAQHFLGAHWDPLFEQGVHHFVQDLPEISTLARQEDGWLTRSEPPADGLPAGPPGALLYASMALLNRVTDPQNLSAGPEEMSAHQHGVGMAIRSDADSNRLVGLHPWDRSGSQHRVRLRQVHLWESGVEAQLTVDLGEAELSFFDTAFIPNRRWYTPGADLEVLLCGIAYNAEANPDQDFTLLRSPEHFDAMQWLTGEDHRPADGSLEERFSTAGMASLIEMPGGDRDEYQFTGPVTCVIPEQLYGQPGWRVRVTVLRFDDEAMDLEMLITARAWKGSTAPQVGEDLRGHLWLQGQLWMCNGLV